MRTISKHFALLLVILLGLILFLSDLFLFDFGFWVPCLLLLVVVYRWGKRTDIYSAAAILSGLVIIDYQMDSALNQNLFDRLLGLVVLWAAAWLLVQHRTLHDKLVAQQQLLLHHGKELEEQVEARTAELRASEQQLAKIFRANPGGIAITRQSDGRYLEANPAFLDMVGYTREHLIGHTAIELGILTPEVRARITSAARESGYGRGLDLQIGNAQGEVVNAIYSVEHLEFEGEPSFLILAIDISERKRIEGELHRLNVELEERVAQRTSDLQTALAELQGANRLKDEFMAIISHELRTPLTGVLSMAELLEDQLAGPLNERQALYVKGIIESGMRLLYVVNGILSYTHLVSGKIQLEHGPIDLKNLLRICAISQQRKADARQQTISLAVEPATLAITSDATAIAEVIKRLLDNAIKFTPEGGQVGVTAQRGPSQNTVNLVVWDTGIGIRPDQFERIVRPFAQADSSLARNHEGLGMGLAYVDQMVRRLGGTLTLDSEPGRGSRFTITLPAESFM